MVVVYSKPNCQPCKATKRALEKKGIPFDEVDISTNAEARELIVSLGYKSAPVVITDDDQWSGFKSEKINALVA